MSTPVKLLVIDPGRGYQREIEAGEIPVDGDGNSVLFPGYGPPVATIPALRAVLPVRRVDQQVRLVEDADPNTAGVDYPSNYAWDATSTDADDPGSPGHPPAVVLPDDAPAVGRWIRTYAEVNNHHEIHEIGGRDEITIENLITDEFSVSSSSSSPSPGDPIQVIVPDGAGGVQWIDLNVRIEDSVTAETNVGKVLQPDGLGGVAWQPYDPVIEGNLDMNCNDILHAGGVYFCDFGSSSTGSGSSGTTDLWIRPDFDTGEQLEYHAEGGHRFESPVMLTGTLYMANNDILDAGDITLPWTSKIHDDNGAEFYFSLHEANFVQAIIRDTYDKDGVVYPRHENISTHALASVGLIIHTFGDGDALIAVVSHDNFGGGNEKLWSFGIDSSDADKFKIHNSGSLADVSLFELTTAGALTLVAGLTLGGSLAMGANAVTGVADPSNAQDAATKAYVDTQVAANNELSEILANGNDAACQDIINVDGIYFCDFGSSSTGSGSSGVTDLWIRPDRDTGQQLEYHAEGGHRFESPVAMTGILSMNDSNILLGGGGIGNDAGVMTFAAGGTGATAIAGAVSIAGHLGVVTAAHADRTIYTEETSADNNPYALWAVMTGTSAGDYAQGGLIKVLAGANDMTIEGLRVAANPLSTRTGLEITGLTIAASFSGSSGSAGYGIYVGSMSVGSGTVTDAYGVYIAAPAQSGGTLTNAYSLYVNAPSTASTLNWAIYSTGAVFVDGDVLSTSFSIGANTLTTTEWANLDGLDQALDTAQSPSFAGLGLTGNLLVAGNAIGNDSAILTFVNGAGGGRATFTGGVSVGGDVYVAGNGIGNNASVLTFAVGVDGAAAFAGDVDVVGHVETDDAYYLGDPTADGSWRIRRDDWDLIFEQRDAGGWDECDRMVGCASSSSA